MNFLLILFPFFFNCGSMWSMESSLRNNSEEYAPEDRLYRVYKDIKELEQKTSRRRSATYLNDLEEIIDYCTSCIKEYLTIPDCGDVVFHLQNAYVKASLKKIIINHPAQRNFEQRYVPLMALKAQIDLWSKDGFLPSHNVTKKFEKTLQTAQKGYAPQRNRSLPAGHSFHHVHVPGAKDNPITMSHDNTTSNEQDSRTRALSPLANTNRASLGSRMTIDYLLNAEPLPNLQHNKMAIDSLLNPKDS